MSGGNPEVAKAVRVSRRVRRLMGAAIQRALAERFDVSIEHSEAEILGAAGSIRHVVGELETLMQVRHRGRQVRLRQDIQRRIAVQKLILRSAGKDSEARKAARQAIDNILDEHENRARERMRASEVNDALEERMVTLQRQWPRRRRFFRRATRLRRRQHLQIEIHLGPGAELERVLTELDSIYDAYLRRAHELLENEVDG